MRISHFGCGVYFPLVITGKEAGYIWVDDRSSDYGIYPAIPDSTGKHMNFTKWYNEWITESISESEA